MEKPGYISLKATQIARKVVLVVLLLIGFMGIALTESVLLGYDTHELVEEVGLGMLLVCILGRVWCSLYIGGRKIRELVTNGPYSMTRNPLYVFSLIGAIGVGAQSGSVLVSVLTLIAAYTVFAVLVRQEEKALLAVHGEEFAAYMKSTPRFLPNPRLWWDREVLSVVPIRVVRTFADGLFFLLAIPLAEGLEYLQEIGMLPVLANIP